MRLYPRYAYVKFLGFGLRWAAMADHLCLID